VREAEIEARTIERKGDPEGRLDRGQDGFGHVLTHMAQGRRESGRGRLEREGRHRQSLGLAAETPEGIE
jgi:hypothetical protein